MYWKLRIFIAYFQHWKAAGVDQCVLCHRQVKTPTHKGPYSWHEVRKGQQPKGMAIIFLRRPASVGLLSIPGPALPASQTSLEICLAANMLWKALISYVSRSSVLQDNKLYLILLCSLMSQLQGLVLPLSMRLFFFFLQLSQRRPPGVLEHVQNAWFQPPMLLYSCTFLSATHCVW